MRYLLTFVLLALLAAPVVAAEKSAQAVDEPPKMGGFEGPVSGAKAETVAKAMKLLQDDRVVLTGNVISRMADENNEYVFKDSTGEIQVRITPKQFKGNVIKPQTKVRLLGKVDKSGSSADGIKIKVTSLEVLD